MFHFYHCGRKRYYTVGRYQLQVGWNNPTYRAYNPSYTFIRPFRGLITPFITGRDPPCNSSTPINQIPPHPLHHRTINSTRTECPEPCDQPGVDDVDLSMEKERKGITQKCGWKWKQLEFIMQQMGGQKSSLQRGKQNIISCRIVRGLPSGSNVGIQPIKIYL